MAQRTLVLGLGSTGFDACKYLLDRVEWECGGLERAPWLQVLVMETETLAGDTPILRNTIGINIDKNTYASFLANPQEYASKLDLSEFHLESLQTMGTAGVTKGAGNIRMVGRLALLFPGGSEEKAGTSTGNIQRVREEIKVRLDRLSSSNLTPALAGQARGELADGSVQDVPLPDDINVFVVGTLVGGTCSGSFIDLGYLLHSEFGTQGHNLNRYGIFALPHISYDPNKWQRRRANAWAALNELNHYHAGHPYSVQSPLHANQKQTVLSVAPFDTTYLVQPRGGDDASFETLKLAMGQFLHASIFSGNAAQIGARLIDGATNVSAGDANGSPQTFYTFGLSSVEIPGYLIAQGCCYKLGVESLDDYLSARPNAQAEAPAFRANTLGLSTEKIHDRLLRLSNSTEEVATRSAAKTVIKDELRAAIANARVAGKGVVAELGRAEELANTAFAPPTEKSRLPSVPALLEANRHLVGSELELGLWSEFQKALLDPTRGPVWCRAMLDDAQSWTGERLKQLKDQAVSDGANRNVSNARSAMGAARERVEACLGDPFLRAFGGVSRSVARHLSEYEEAALLWLERRLDFVCLGSERELLERIEPVLGAMRGHILDRPDSIEAQARLLRDRLNDRFVALQTTAPAINGKAIFEPNKTISESYERSWSALGKAEREGAKRRFLATWEVLPRHDENGQLTAPEAFFRPSPPLTAQQLAIAASNNAEKLARAARAARTQTTKQNYFREATSEKVLSRLTPVDTDLLRDLWQKSAPLLAANLANPIFSDTGANHADLVFLPPDDGSGAQTQVAGALDNVVGGGASLRREAVDDPQSLSLLRAIGGFPLAIIQGFQAPQFEQTNFRHSFDEESKGKIQVWSRNDTARWHPFYGDKDAQSSWRQGLFLSGLALSRSGQPGDSLIKPKGGGFVYRPEQAFSPGESEVHFPSDLRAIAQRMREHIEGQNRLLSDITAIHASQSAQVLASALSDLYNNIESLALRRSTSIFARKAGAPVQNDAPPADEGVTAGLAYELLLAFWKGDPKVTALLSEPFTKAEGVFQKHIEWHDGGEKSATGATFLAGGFYCLHASHAGQPMFLGGEASEVPSTCPRCNVPCR